MQKIFCNGNTWKQAAHVQWHTLVMKILAGRRKTVEIAAKMLSHTWASPAQNSDTYSDMSYRYTT